MAGTAATFEEPEMKFHEVNVPETRPALWAGGVPLEVAAALIVATTGLATLAWYWGLFMVPVWAAVILVIRHDYNILRVFWADLRVTWMALDSHIWGGSSVSAFPVKPYRHFHGTRRAARAARADARRARHARL